jgi:hypothetical protein
MYDYGGAVVSDSSQTKPHREWIIKGHTVLIDEEDYPMLSRLSWNISKSKRTFYAGTKIFMNGRQRSLLMHRMITGFVASQIDHKNHNGLDNRKENLRHATKRQNSINHHRKNKWGYRGVYQKQDSKNFAFQISVAGRKIHSKSGFPTPEAAARAYDLACKEYHGEFGIRNFED